MTSIEKLGFSECTPIQAASIPHILSGKDMAGLAQTGTGKTAAFVIPLMDRILKSRISQENLSEEQKAALANRFFSEWRPHNFVLILVPTRELAEQVQENIHKLGEASGLRGFAIYGGTGYDRQKEAIRNGVEFVVATPGRLIDLYKEHVVDLKQVRAIVFDEADRMFDMGFKEDMKYILSRIPRERQFLVYSATLNFDVLNTAYQFGAEPIEVDVSRDQAKADNVKDEIFHVGHEEKPQFLLSLLKKYNPKQAIIFSNFKFNVERIARFLTENGVPAMAISSLLTQAQRNRVMELFKADNEKNILVATDVAARGLDIKGVDMVVNFELPNDAESYVHRIGRTGRAGLEGQAFSLVCDRDVDSLARVEDYLKHKLPVGWMEDSDIVKEFKPMSRDEGFSRPSFDRQDGRRRDGRDDRGRRGERDNRGRRDDRARRDQRDARGPRRDQAGRGEGRPQNAGGRAEHPNGPRRGGESQQRRGGGGQGPQRQHRGNGHAHPKQGGPRRPHQQDQRRHSPAHAKGGKPQMAPRPAPGIAKKVSGFFKKLLGG
jgi:ATP-dependent RNA helicase RhlB